MSEGQKGRKWYHHAWEWIATVFRKISIPGTTGVIVIAAFLATVLAAWKYPDSAFGNFSKSLGITIAGVFVGIWGADFYHRKDAYKKRYRDVEISVYTTWLLIAGVETIKLHIANAKAAILATKPSSDIGHANKLTAHSEIEAGHTAAKLTINMSYMALANLETFSEDAVKSGKIKFATSEREATVRQQIVEGEHLNTTMPEIGESSSGGNND